VVTAIGKEVVLDAPGKAALAGGKKELSQTLERIAVEAMKREGAELGRFGARAADVAGRRLEMRAGGIELGLRDRSGDFAKAIGRAEQNAIVEEIGLDGARAYAEHVGYEPLYVGRPRQGAGFDLVCRDGNRIKVIEAKGGASQPQMIGGHLQGTPEYARDVANRVLQRPAANQEQKKAAEEVLAALKAGRLDIEIVRTAHVEGKPGVTRVAKIVGPNGVVTLSQEEVRALLVHTCGMAGARVRQSGAAQATIGIQDWLNQGRPVARRTGIALWAANAGPLASRRAVRRGVEVVLPTALQPVQGPPTEVGEFAVALMERGL
jgi:hypothetical protein